MASRGEIALRKQEALQRLVDGWGCSELTSKLANQWGCSRRQARRHDSEAHQELVADLEHVEAATLLASLINRLERIAHKAEQDNQLAAAVGACRLLGELVISPQRNKQSTQFGSFS
jgi:sulfite reductase beta subunit-like hemoprotein